MICMSVSLYVRSVSKISRMIRPRSENGRRLDFQDSNDEKSLDEAFEIDEKPEFVPDFGFGALNRIVI